jgi:hypothetical protein
MTPDIDHEERELDRRWRERFGQPPPLLGCAVLGRAVLDAAELPTDAAEGLTTSSGEAPFRGEHRSFRR